MMVSVVERSIVGGMCIPFTGWPAVKVGDLPHPAFHTRTYVRDPVFLSVECSDIVKLDVNGNVRDRSSEER